MKIGIDASPVIGDRGGVGWHTYSLLQAMLAAKQNVDFVGYLRPGSAPPQEIQGWAGADRLCWVHASKWAMQRRGSADRLDLYHGTNFRMHTTGRYGGVVTIHDLWLERFPEYSPKFLGQKLSSYKTKRTARARQKSHHRFPVLCRRTDGAYLVCLPNRSQSFPMAYQMNFPRTVTMRR